MYSEQEISDVIEAVNRLGSQRAAAKELGLSRRSLQRRVAAGKSEDGFLERKAEELGFDAEEVNHYWVKTSSGSFHVKRDTDVSYSDIREEFLESVKNYAPDYAKIPHVPEENLLVIDAADVHWGKLSVPDETGYSYSMKEATRRVREGVTNLVYKAKPFGIDRIVFVLGNDAIHIDSPHRKTTSGTPQDTDGQWWQMFKAAKACYIAVIEELTRIAPVHLIFCPSNHDYASGWMLADSVCSWFANNPNVNAEEGSVAISHRKYIRYGNSLLGFTHGDGARENELAQLMQYEARVSWGETKFAYWFTHHTHHKDRKVYGKDRFKIEKDHTGVTILNSRHIDPTNNVFVETIRTPSPPDGWHDRNGYKNVQAIECFLIEPDRGMSCRFTEYF